MSGRSRPCDLHCGESGSLGAAKSKSAWAVPAAVVHAHEHQQQSKQQKVSLSVRPHMRSSSCQPSSEPRAVAAPTKVDPDEGLPEPHWPYTKPVWAGFAIEWVNEERWSRDFLPVRPVDLSAHSTVLKSLGFRAPPPRQQQTSAPSAPTAAHKRRKR